MAIFIAYNYDGVPLSIVNARSDELAIAYWQGAGVDVHTIKTLKDFTPLLEHPTGVYPIMKTVAVKVSTLRQDATIITVHK